MSLSPIDPSLKQLAQEIAAAMVEQLWERLREGDILIPPAYLTPKQVAQFAGISRKTLESMRGTRRGPKYFKPSGRVLYRIEDIRVWIEAGGPVK